MHELPDEYLADALAVAKRIALEKGLENYNILQVRLHLAPLPFLSSPSPRLSTPPRPSSH